MKWLLATILLLSVLGALWYAGAGSGSAEPVVRGGPFEIPPDADPARPAVVLAAPAAEPESGAAVTEAPVEDPARTPAAASARRGPRTLVGVLRVTEKGGAELPEVDGELTLAFFLHGEDGEEDGFEVAVDVTGGRFELTLHQPFDRYRPTKGKARGRSLQFADDILELPREDRLEVEARVRAGNLLRVVDDASGADLDRVTVLSDPSWGAQRDLGPRLDFDYPVIAEDRPSPIDVPAEGWVAHFWVGAEGYAWRKVHMDSVENDRERTVRLQPGGGLLVSTFHLPEDQEVRLRLRHPDGSEGSDIGPADAAKPVRLTGLPEGRLRVCAEIGDEYRELRLAEEEVDVVAGSVTEVVLHLADVPYVPAGVPVAGTLFSASYEPPEDAELQLDLEGKPEVTENRKVVLRLADCEPAGERTWRFDAGRLVPGTYTWNVIALGWQGTFEVPPGGVTDLWLEVPELAELKLRLRAGDETVHCDWVFIQSHGGPGHRRCFPRKDEEGKFYEVLSPPGLVQVGLFDEEWRLAGDGKLEVPPGRTERVLDVVGQSSLKVEFASEGTLVPFNHTAGIEAREVGGDGRDTGGSFNGRSARVLLSGPGRYEVSVTGLDGYEPVESQVVDVGVGEQVKVTFEVREKSG